MSAETAQIPDIASGAAINEKKPQPKRPETPPRRPISDKGPQVVQDTIPSWTNADVVKYFEDARERMREAFDQASGRFDHIRDAARDTSDVLQDCHSATLTGLKELNEQVLEHAQTELDRFYDYGRQLTGVKSISDAVKLHGDFIREGFEAQMERTRALSALTTNLFKSTIEPLQTGMASVISEAKKRQG